MMPDNCALVTGLSLVAVRSAGALVAFGGYNGKYHNSAQVFRPGEDIWACCCLPLMSQDIIRKGCLLKGRPLT